MKKNEDIEIESLLRIKEEPCVYINELQAHKTLITGCEEFMELLLNFYRTWANVGVDIDLPKKQVYAKQGIKGDLRLMPCFMHDEKLKFVKVVGTNEEERTIKDKICVGKSFLVDYFDNYIYAIFDACVLSSFRTAAISALAFCLSTSSLSKIGLVGTGRIGFYTAYILYRWLGFCSFMVMDANEHHRMDFEALCRHYMPESEIHVREMDEVISTSEALFLSTTSTDPLLSAVNAKSLRFISSVGADADNLSELDSSLLATHRLLTDSMDSCCLGDMKRWINENMLSRSEVTDLRTVAGEEAFEHPRNMFVSTGIAVQDLFVCRFVYEKLYAKGGKAHIVSSGS